ncbi:histidinol-phosphate transaminase [Nesterenkonia flava]|uniref:Histidinol-phosphate aminotransferase n=1 Tax=Nesterenkonia flava TaxID=469799 RepID=A0ABU1FSH9_9MICC|nr:histidinol-phosphate transaminase [Nesterenkonia flava]MDR5711628.1 histidinol-phosphate transaminase [Nesterenkonia flava]
MTDQDSASTDTTTAEEDAAKRLAALPLRDELRGQHPYGAPQLNVKAMLNVNETTYDVPEDVVDAITKEVRRASATLNRYPDREFTLLRQKLAEYLNRDLVSDGASADLTADHIWAGNGSNEVMQHILQAFAGPGRTVMSFPPTYSMYPLYARGIYSEYIAGTRSPDFTQDPQDVADQIRQHRPHVVILCSPNNPTGTALGLDVVEAAYEAARESQTMVIVDEAYGEFRQPGTPSALQMLPGRPRLIVTRTMSKAFALAGGRLGYLAAAPEVTDALRLVRLPYHLSAVTQATACAALDHSETLMANVEKIKLQRDRIVTELRRLGLTPAPSDANFVFFGGLVDKKAAWEHLLADGILIRDVGIEGHLRVTAGTEEETTAFLESLRRHLQTQRAGAQNHKG